MITPGVDAGPVFYPDVPADVQQNILGSLVKHPKACSFYTPNLSAYDEIPTMYIYCEKDVAFPYLGQKAVVAMHKSKGIQIDEVTLPSGHFPSLSMPERLAEVILQD